MVTLFARLVACRACIRLVLAVGAILALGVPAQARILPKDGVTPVIIFLDGIEPKTTISGNPLGTFQVRTENYLIRALGSDMWGYEPGSADVLTVPWSGDLRDYPGVQQYITLTRDWIRKTVRDYPNRPIIVVAHSWGSVVAYQALTELQSQFVSGKRAVGSGAIALFVSMGSPLASKSSWVLTMLSLIPGEAPGEQFVNTTKSHVVLRKPDTVGYWINYWVAQDKIAGEQTAADENVKWSSLLFPPAFPWTHREYYTELTRTLAEELDIERILDNDCRNLYTVNSGAPPTGWGAAYNVFSLAKELEIKVTCHGKYSQPRTVAETRPGATLVVGSGLSSQTIYEKAIVWRNNAWQFVQLSGVSKVGSFFNGEARADLPFTGSELAVGNRNFVAGYVCQSGKCGCADATCATHLWQPQSFQR